MEPPPKRMRILQSIGVDEVDETNPEYIEGKKQNSEWLKTKFDAICAKYGAMSDMMSDELDMRGNGAIVKDRGHMRKLDKEYRKRFGRRTVLDETQLADDLFVNDPEMEGVDEEEESEYDDRDELAPSQSPEPACRKSDTMPAGGAQDQHEPPLQARKQIVIPTLNTPTNTALQATLTSSAKPPADLIQLVQFPQTPAGQEARRAFEAQTAQAVQQAVASILSSLLPNAAGPQTPRLNLLQSPASPAVNQPEVAPATEPCLSHPPPPLPGSDLPATVQSSLIAATQTVQKQRRSFALGVHIKPKRHDSTWEEVPLILEDDLVHSGDAEEASESSVNGQAAKMDTIGVQSLTAQSQEHRGRRSRYVFTTEDDQYIIESKVVHKRKWGEIINSRAQWKNWPKLAFHNHWTKSLRKKAVNMNLAQSNAGIERPEAGSPAQNQSLPKQGVQLLSSPTAARHLPTPSSLEHDECEHHGTQPMLENIEDTIVSGGHFDDDESDLLSTYGDNNPTCDVQDDPLGSDVKDDLIDEVQEIPETPLELTQEDSIQQALQGTVTRENTVDLIAASVEIERTQPEAKSSQDASMVSVPSSSMILTNTTTQQTPLTKMATTVSSFPTKSTPKSKPRLTMNYQVESEDTEDEIDLVCSEPSATDPHQCPMCKQTFSTAAFLRAHKKQPHPKEVPYRASSPSLPATQYDPLGTQTGPLAPTTPVIKLEPLDPTQNLLLSTPAFKAPMSAPQTKGLHSSGAKSSGKLSRSAYNKVKASWARKATPAPRKRHSFHVTPKKRVWHDFDDGSEDELAR